MKPMSFVLGALALGWLATGAQAAESPYSGAPRAVVNTAQAPAPAAPGFVYAPEANGGPGGCCDVGCDPCGGHGCRFYAGGGVYYLQPRFETDPAIVANFSTAFDAEQLGLDGTGLLLATFFPNIATELSFAYEYEIAPRVWAGFTTDCGCGVRGRYWGIDQDANKFINLFGITIGNILLDPGGEGEEELDFLFAESSTVFARSELKLDVFDIELTYEANCCGWWLVSCGVRYVEIQQSYGGLLNATLTSTSEQAGNVLVVTQDEVLGVDDDFEALGPTAALEFRCPTGCFNLCLYGSGRLSLLVGHGETRVRRLLERTQDSDVDGTLDFQFNGSGSVLRDRDDMYWVGELELGVECCKTCGCAEVFGRVALVTQAWWDFVIPSSTVLGASDIFRGFEALETRNSRELENDLHFFGVTAVAGVKF
jgi:hypothetical protein